MEGKAQYPLVSILIPVYNRAQWIGQAIESALQQDYPNLEIIVNDDCSTDETIKVINKYLNDPRIKLTANSKNLGLIGNFNRVFFELAKGEYVTLLGSDDYLVNHSFISKTIDITKRYNNIALVFCKTNIFDEDTLKISEAGLTSRFDVEFRSGHEAFLDFSDHPYYTSGGVIYSLRHLNENKIIFSGKVTADIEMNLELMLVGNVGYLNETVYTIRIHSQNASSNIKDIDLVEDSYLKLIRLLDKKAKPFIPNHLLRQWYKKVIERNLEICFNLVKHMKNRKQYFEFCKLLIKNYKKEFLRLLLKKPKYFIKILLGK